MSLREENTVIFRHKESGNELWVSDKYQVELMRGDDEWEEAETLATRNRVEEIPEAEIVEKPKAKKAKKSETEVEE